MTNQKDAVGYLLVEVDREVASLALTVPTIGPGLGAKRAEGVVELLAGTEVLALGSGTLVVVDIVLPAVLGLVHLGETSIVTSSDELEGLGLEDLIGVGFRNGTHICDV